MSGDTNIAATETSETESRRSTEDTNGDVQVSILLDELDEEIIHAEEIDLMFKYYNELKEKVRWETRGQHNGKFYAMINAGSKDSSTVASRKEGFQNKRKPPATRQMTNNEASKSSNDVADTATALPCHDDDDHASSKQNTESLLVLSKSLHRQRTTHTSNDKNNNNPDGHQRRPHRRPRLKLYDTAAIGTNGNGSAVLRHSFEIVHDLQLIRASILLPRIYSFPKTTSSSATKDAITNSKNRSDLVMTEWKKNELERYLYAKFWKYCVGRGLVYCRPHHRHDSENYDDMSKNIYWKHFRIQLQSANKNSWRCIVSGYRAMVNDVLLFLQQLKLLTHNRSTNDNKSATTTSSAASSLVGD